MRWKIWFIDQFYINSIGICAPTRSMRRSSHNVVCSTRLVFHSRPKTRAHRQQRTNRKKQTSRKTVESSWNLWQIVWCLLSKVYCDAAQISSKISERSTMKTAPFKLIRWVMVRAAGRLCIKTEKFKMDLMPMKNRKAIYRVSNTNQNQSWKMSKVN